MKRSPILSIAAILIVLQAAISSCTVYPDPYFVDVSRQKANYYYAPASPTVPMLVKKNDLNFEASGVVGDNVKGGSVHAAFRPIKNLGVMASHSWMKNDNQYNNIGRFRNYEIGAGYAGSISSYWHFETYSGIGSGKVINTHYTGTSNLKTNSFFIQPAIAVSDYTQLFQFGFFSKFSWTKFSLLDTSFNNDREPVVTHQMKLLHDDPRQLFWEPGFIFKAGWKFAQFNISYTFSSDLTNKEILRKKNLFNIGMSIKLNTKNPAVK